MNPDRPLTFEERRENAIRYREQEALQEAAAVVNADREERSKAHLYITFKDGNDVTTTCSDLAAPIDAARLVQAGVVAKVEIRFTSGTFVTVTSGRN